jgi:multiple sugar transport system permease protein
MRACRSRAGHVVATILAFIFPEQLRSRRAGRTRDPHAAGRQVQRLTFEQLAWGPLAAAAIVVTLPVLLLTIDSEGNRRRTHARRHQGLIGC